ncbi:SGNH/GDSL hydrolase family protein [Agromyces cerinus]|uniref:Lysophospholipase L1 n=1 Tax=Agromyces cerinus subsp. cerinus TaxID=232089 RepID=A0A1N6I5F6_9MICO|nr:SGNH/GDSL hydrolase family protein [Agromyces cerinus]SIO27155.1 Lysophospholipase L1 [Agromyces cerinus subsp. cerinus]
MVGAATAAAGRAARGIGAAFMGLACASMIVGCSAREPADGTGSPEASALAVLGTFAAVGDSITDADSPDFAAGDIGDASWTRYVVDDGFDFAGGWAEWGATTAMMADAVGRVDADVLVLLAGTNDVAFGIPFEDSAANLDRIVEVVGIEEVVVVSIPPMDTLPAGAEAYNERLHDLATDQGWRFVDASAGLGTADGRFGEGMSLDGLHPSAEGARVLGEAIATALREE